MKIVFNVDWKSFMYWAFWVLKWNTQPPLRHSHGIKRVNYKWIDLKNGKCHKCLADKSIMPMNWKYRSARCVCVCVKWCNNEHAPRSCSPDFERKKVLENIEQNKTSYSWTNSALRRNIYGFASVHSYVKISAASERYLRW